MWMLQINCHGVWYGKVVPTNTNMRTVAGLASSEAIGDWQTMYTSRRQIPCAKGHGEDNLQRNKGICSIEERICWDCWTYYCLTGQMGSSDDNFLSALFSLMWNNGRWWEVGFEVGKIISIDDVVDLGAMSFTSISSVSCANLLDYFQSLVVCLICLQAFRHDIQTNTKLEFNVIYMVNAIIMHAKSCNLIRVIYSG